MNVAETFNIPANLPTWLGVAVVITLAVIAILPALLGAITTILQVKQSRRAKQNSEKIDKAQQTLEGINEQVTNGGTNLAEELQTVKSIAMNVLARQKENRKVINQTSRDLSALYLIVGAKRELQDQHQHSPGEGNTTGGGWPTV